MALESRFDLNPDYGSGTYRRRIVLQAINNTVLANVIDDYHEMACVLHHDGSCVTAISGRIDRAPFSTCAAAPVALQELVGLPLATSRAEIYGGGRARRNCTHLFDIAAMAIGVALSGDRLRSFDFVVPDETEFGMMIDAWVGQSLVHRWTLREEVIVSPPQMSGRSLFGGFATWANSQFEGVTLDAALHLQKVVFVARGRRFKISDPEAGSIRDEPERLGACYTFSEPRFSTAVGMTDYVRDFTAGLPDRSPN